MRLSPKWRVSQIKRKVVMTALLRRLREWLTDVQKVLIFVSPPQLSIREYQFISSSEFSSLRFEKMEKLKLVLKFSIIFPETDRLLSKISFLLSRGYFKRVTVPIRALNFNLEWFTYCFLLNFN